MSVALAARGKVGRPTILDENGRPLAPTARRMIAPNPGGMDTYNTHPAFDLTLEMLLSYYRQAERGQPLRQMDCFHDIIEMDPDLRSKINDRVESVSGCDWVVMAGAPDKPSELAAATLNERLQNQIKFRTYLTHQLTAVAYGYACTNIVWDLVDGAVVPVDFVNPAARRFASPSAERAHELWLVDGNRIDLIPLEWGLWSCSIYRNILSRNPYAGGLMRSGAVWAMFKRWGVKGWQIFADMFGIPLALGYYEEGAGEASRRALEDAVRAIGQDGYAVLSSLTELVVKETARGGDSSTVYPQLIKLCEEQIAKLFTGGTLNTDVAGVGSYNAASVHESRSYAQKCYDAQMLQETFTASIAAAFNVWNGFDRAAPPRLKIKIRRDALQWAQTLEILGQAVKLSKSQIQEDFNLREPSGPDDEVEFAPTAPPDPGHAREDKKR